jgi:TMEM175 potassium channel family protein
MTGPGDGHVRSDTGRAVAFTDAILAIVITPLVLDVRVPDVEPYVYLAVVWLNHKATFRRIRAADRGLHWVNLTGSGPYELGSVARQMGARRLT